MRILKDSDEFISMMNELMDNDQGEKAFKEEMDFMMIYNSGMMIKFLSNAADLKSQLNSTTLFKECSL